MLVIPAVLLGLPIMSALFPIAAALTVLSAITYIRAGVAALG